MRHQPCQHVRTRHMTLRPNIAELPDNPNRYDAEDGDTLLPAANPLGLTVDDAPRSDCTDLTGAPPTANE